MDNAPISQQLLQPIIKSNIQYVNSIEEMEQIKLQPNEICMRFDNNSTCFYIRSTDSKGNYEPIKVYFYEDFATKMQKYSDEDFFNKCKALKLDPLKTEIAYKFFIENEKPMKVWLWLLQTKKANWEEDTVRRLKSELKKKLLNANI